MQGQAGPPIPSLVVHRQPGERVVALEHVPGNQRYWLEGEYKAYSDENLQVALISLLH